MWPILNGSFLQSRGAIFPALKANGFTPEESRRIWSAFRHGVWRINECINRWRRYVYDEGGWRSHSYEGHRPLAVDWTAIWRCQATMAGRFFPAACERETKTFKRKVAKAEKALAKLSRQTFACGPDAQKAVDKEVASWRYHQATVTIEPVMGYDSPGRPAQGSQPTVQGYRIVGSVVPKEALLVERDKRRGKFIIATNQLDADKLYNIVLSKGTI
jgi:hypothetical protein